MRALARWLARTAGATGALVVAGVGLLSGCARPQEVQALRQESAAATALALAVPTQAPPALAIPAGAGRLVSVGAHRLYIECLGSGSPTVVLDAGADPHRRAWDRVLDGVKGFTRICIYDRAGTGSSENAPTPRTSEEVVRELRILLTNSGLTGPFVLAGHAFGGLNVRLYASRHPADVAGLVLLNPFEEDSFLQYVSQLTPGQLAGYVRLTTAMGEGLDPVASSLQIVGAPALRRMPGVIVAPRKGIPAANRDYLAALSQRLPGSRLMYADDSGPYVHLDEPALAISAVLEVILAVRG